MSNIVKADPQLPALPDMFVKEHTVVKCMEKFSAVTTPLAAIKTEAVSLAKLKKTYSADWIRAYIAGWILNMNDFLNVSRPMNDVQIEETAFLIVQKYYYLNVADITLIFTRAKTGEFGKLYESIDGVKILTWFESYANERATMAEGDFLQGESGKHKDTYKRTSDMSDIKTLDKRARGFMIIENSKKQK